MGIGFWISGRYHYIWLYTCPDACLKNAVALRNFFPAVLLRRKEAWCVAQGWSMHLACVGLRVKPHHYQEEEEA